MQFPLGAPGFADLPWKHGADDLDDFVFQGTASQHPAHAEGVQRLRLQFAANRGSKA